MKPHKVEGFQKKGRKIIVKCQTILLADSEEAAIQKLKRMNRKEIRDINFNMSYKLRAFEIDENGERVKKKAEVDKTTIDTKVPAKRGRKPKVKPDVKP